MNVRARLAAPPRSQSLFLEANNIQMNATFKVAIEQFKHARPY